MERLILENLIARKVKIGGYGGAAGRSGLVSPQGAISYTTGMGKGLREPCPPYRQTTIFEAELGTPNADFWNCAAQVLEPTTTFDLSSITQNHEVMVALLVAYNIPAGSSYQVEHKWYRDRDGKLLFTLPFNIPDPASFGYISWAWYYVYSYIGYVPWEISENGGYHVDITVSGIGENYSTRLNFNVTGVNQVAQYTEIVAIVAPAEAVPGSRVDVTVRVKNIYSSPISIMVRGALEYGITPWPSIDIFESFANVDGGTTYPFSGSFVMPDSRVTLHAYSYWYGDDGYWHLEDELTKVINPQALTQQMSEFKIADFCKI